MRTFFNIPVIAVLAFALLFVSPPLSFAQDRLSDSDIANTMKNLIQDAKHFQSSFNAAVSKSAIRKTSQEKDAKNLVKSFRGQSETMLKIFKSRKKADSTLPGVLNTSTQIDTMLSGIALGGSAAADWAKCKSDLVILANAFQMNFTSN